MWYKGKERRLDDFARFSRATIVSGDVDPQFWILRQLYDTYGLDANEALWFTCVYLMYYHLGSACQAWDRYSHPEIITKKTWQNDLPYFKQRRCFRGNDHARDQVNEILKVSDGDIAGWVEKTIGDGGEEGWQRLREAVSQIPYHGPWSSYKFCDMAKFVHLYPITAPDIGNKPGSTAGPIAGLTTLTGMDWRKCADDNQLHRDLLLMMHDRDVPMIGLDHLESMLCDYQSLTNARYYVGHDIDRDQDQLMTAPKGNDHANTLWEARDDLFDERLLGEFHDWVGVQGHLNKVYRDRRRIINDYEDLKEVELL